MFSVSSDDILILIYVFGKIQMLEANILVFSIEGPPPPPTFG